MMFPIEPFSTKKINTIRMGRKMLNIFEAYSILDVYFTDRRDSETLVFTVTSEYWP